MLTTITLTGLWLYPVKSCRGLSVPEAQVGPRGMRYDREWMVVQPNGAFLTQRQHPRLAVIAPSFQDDQLALNAPEMPPISVPIHDMGRPVEVTVWRDRCAAVDQGDAAAAWLTHVLDTPCRLVRLAETWVRQVDPSYARPDDQVGFADGFPFLLASESSLADLNRRLARPVPMERFRPNLVVQGAAPYAEDTWRRIRIGAVSFRVVKPCARCVTTTVDQTLGVRASNEPLETLARYRLQDRGVMFAQNLLHDGNGALRIGDRLTLLP